MPLLMYVFFSLPLLPAFLALAAEPVTFVADEVTTPELRLLSLDVQGRASCSVANVSGKAPLCLPRSGRAEAAAAYRLHLWDADGRETQLPALCFDPGFPLGRYAAWHSIPAGGSEWVDIDFPPLSPEQQGRTRRMAVSYDPARCEEQEWRVPTPREGAPAPALAPAMVSAPRSLLPNGWEGLGISEPACELRLLTLDVQTGEATCSIRHTGVNRERAYFVPGNSWGDECFSLKVLDARGQELCWRIPPRDYYRNGPRYSCLKGGTSQERMDFAFDEVEEPTEAQAAFLASLRRPGAQVRLDYRMSQASFLSAHFDTDGTEPEAVEHFETQRRRMLRGMSSAWQNIDALPKE